MRSVVLAALSASAALATISVAFAQNEPSVSDPTRETTNQAVRNNPPGITVEQENAIPYRPCMEAYGWANGRLRCDNN
jgi:hypothetical protein